MPDYTMKNLYDAGQFVEGIEYASDPEIREKFTEWDYLFLSKCLYKLKRYSDFLDLYKEFHKKYPESDKLNDNMGWSLYQIHIKNFDYENGNRQQFLKQIDYILDHCTDSQYSPRNWIATVATNAIFKSKLSVNVNYELGNKYLSVVDPMSLDLREQENNVDGRIIKTASEREKWYGRKTKALVELEEYEECLHYIEEAFQNVDRFHNNGKHWLNYKKALCLLNLGDIDTAESIINQILKTFSHWVLYELLFKIDERKNDTDKALKHGSICATVDREHKLRVSFYEAFAHFLLENGYEREAALHFKLVEIIREEEQWKSIKLPEGFSYPSEVQQLDKKEIIKELNSFWNKEKEIGVQFYEGIIARILPNGKSGFIEDGKGSSYYFNIQDFTRRVYELTEGTRVRFALEERLDKKKNEIKLNAVQISLIK